MRIITEFDVHKLNSTTLHSVRHVKLWWSKTVFIMNIPAATFKLSDTFPYHSVVHNVFLVHFTNLTINFNRFHVFSTKITNRWSYFPFGWILNRRTYFKYSKRNFYMVECFRNGSCGLPTDIGKQRPRGMPTAALPCLNFITLLILKTRALIRQLI